MFKTMPTRFREGEVSSEFSVPQGQDLNAGGEGSFPRADQAGEAPPPGCEDARESPEGRGRENAAPAPGKAPPGSVFSWALPAPPSPRHLTRNSRGRSVSHTGRLGPRAQRPAEVTGTFITDVSVEGENSLVSADRRPPLTLRSPPHGTFLLRVSAHETAGGRGAGSLAWGGTSACSQFTGTPSTQRAPQGLPALPKPQIRPRCPPCRAERGQVPGQRRVGGHLCDGGWTRGRALNQGTCLDPKRTTGLAW